MKNIPGMVNMLGYSDNELGKIMHDSLQVIMNQHLNSWKEQNEFSDHDRLLNNSNWMSNGSIEESLI